MKKIFVSVLMLLVMLWGGVFACAEESINGSEMSGGDTVLQFTNSKDYEQLLNY